MMSPIETILNMVADGQITPAAAKKIIQSIHPDTKRVTLRDVAERYPMPGWVPFPILQTPRMPEPVLCGTCKEAYEELQARTPLFGEDGEVNIKGDVTVGGTLNTEA